MEYQDTGKAGYTFNKLPENIRQMGEQPDEKRVYIEDYVVTYMHQVFRKKPDKAIVVLVGKKGEQEAKGTGFIYGALEIEVDILGGVQSFTDGTWERIYELIGRHFKGAQVLGWGCGISIWNSQTDSAVEQLQKKYFKQEGSLFFLEHISEKEEKVFRWENASLKELSGYVIYYEKNPQMQEYMLLGQPKKSFEASYQDKVTANVRKAVKQKEGNTEPKKIAVYTTGVFLLLLMILGGNLLMQSTRKIDDLEKTIETLSSAAIHVSETPQAKEKNSLSEMEKKKKEQQTKVQEEINEDRMTENPLETASVKRTVPPVSLEELVTPKPSENTAPKKTARPEKTTEPVKKAEQGSADIEEQEKAVLRQRPASYVVKAGDTLSQIVWRQYHTLSCMEMVKNANGIKDGDKILEGQVLLLPDYRE